MKKRLTIITFLMLFCSTMFAQTSYPESWGSINDNFENSKTMIGTIAINGVNQDNTDLVIGAFCNGELRGIATLSNISPVPGINVYKYTLTFSGDPNDVIKFKLYDQTLEREFVSEYTVRFSKVVKNTDLNFTYWNKNDIPVIYEEDFTVSAYIYIDNLLQQSDNFELAAFCGDELRAKTKPSYNQEFGYISYLTVKGTTNDVITFKLYDYANHIILDSDCVIKFENGDSYSKYPINFYQSVAKVGDKYYPTLQEAVNNANGETVTLLKDVEAAGVVIDNDVTIDFNNFTYTLTVPAVGSTGTETNGFQILKGENKANKVTFKNGTLNAAAENLNILVENYADLTLEGMKLDGDKTSYALLVNSGEVNIHSSEIIANKAEGEHYAFGAAKLDGYSRPVVSLWYTGTDTNPIFDNIIDGKVELTGGHILGAATEPLQVVAKKTFNPKDGWGTISTLIEGGMAIPATPEGVFHDLYKYDEPTAMWHYYFDSPSAEDHPFDRFEVGAGYIYAGYLSGEESTIIMDGVLHTGSVTFDVTYTEEAGNLKGFNMIGNPFASNIASANFEVEGYQLVDGFYKIDESGAFNANLDQTIAAMESAMIQIVPKDVQTRGAGKFTINPTPLGESKRSRASNASLVINVNNAQYSDRAYVSFGEGLGLNKINHRNAEVPMVYVPVEGEDFAIAKMSYDVTEIPVSFKAATMGEYTIGVEAQNCEYSTMVLVDRFTGEETNLLLEDYSFMATSNDKAERFIVRLSNDNGGNANGSTNFAFINNGELVISNIEGQGIVYIYDVTGRPVAEYNVATSASISTTEFAAGMYIIRMADENGVKVQKIVIE